MRRISYTALILCCVLLCCSCGKTDISVPVPDGSAAQDTDLSMPYIGLVLKSSDNPFFSIIKSSAEQTADEIGAQLIVVAPSEESNIFEQEELLRTMSKMAVDVVIADPCGDMDSTDALSKAEQNGKLILSVDTPLNDSEACYIGTDHYTAARELGAYAAQLITSSQKAVILRGAENDATHDLREQGLSEALMQAGIQSFTTYSCDGSEKEAKAYIKELLNQDDPPALICAASDALALGAADAAYDTGSDVHIVSFDGLSQVTECILDGTIDAAMAQDPQKIGETCIETAVQLFRGEQVDSHVYIPAKLITPENAAQHAKQLSDSAGKTTRSNTTK